MIVATKTYKVGIIGAGLIGKKRASFLAGQRLELVADLNLELAEQLASQYEARATSDFMDIINSDVDIVVVSTPNNLLVPIAIEAVKRNKHVLIEKPGATSPEQMERLIAASKNSKSIIKVGFNHRYHPAMLKAKELMKTRNTGDVMFIRARYGHGGRVGYEKEWRAKKEVSGGGELLDQGCHIIDLGHFFMGEFTDAIGYTPTYFWDMRVEDNGFAILRTAKGQILQMHASWTEWKNIFSFEIMCRNAKIEINGLGKSYGTETLTYYQMKPEMGPPNKEVFTFEGEDISWEREFQEFVETIRKNRQLNDLHEAHSALKHIFSIYSQNPKHKR